MRQNCWPCSPESFPNGRMKLYNKLRKIILLNNFVHRKTLEKGFPGGRIGYPVSAGHQGQPKEMLPIVDKPLIQYAVEEAVAAGITDMVFVTGRSKRAIEDHFDKAYELENELLPAADLNCSNLSGA